MESWYSTGLHRAFHFNDTEEDLWIKYVDCPAVGDSKTLGTILLIHGFPQTSYQFRKVIPGLSKAGYRVVVPDYRGAGGSSKPMKLAGYRKTQMATDLQRLIHGHLGIKGRVHVVGHDIGGMVAHAYASLFADDISSVIWGECPLPGTTMYDQSKTSVEHFHFNFHSVLDLPEALTAGRERIYLQHFYDKLTYNSGAITSADTDFYTSEFSKPGAMRAGFNVYRMFETDKEENLKTLHDHGKSDVRCLALSGAQGHLVKATEGGAKEYYKDVELASVEDSGHYIAEENPEGFVREVLRFINAL